eukprot:TRINITY_DN6679_c0_g1_i1.p1 TRINITY_DN6679_c0_g1~~TRINITY_DN6679_c0_g1_i1.p1  ORF type:complete len:436 (+),score=33.64 TRINITY_DN6679_c0_g1_i1:303-1610(+)
MSHRRGRHVVLVILALFVLVSLSGTEANKHKHKNEDKHNHNHKDDSKHHDNHHDNHQHGEDEDGDGALLDEERIDEAMTDVALMQTGDAAIITTTVTAIPTKHLIPLEASTLYYNLSCPYEWSVWSCAHQDRVDGAQRALAYARSHGVDGAIASIISSGAFRGKRLFLLGDSLSRQLFVGTACATVKQQRKRGVIWPPHFSHSIDLPNLIHDGEHSGFIVGSLKWKEGGEMHLYPLGGMRTESTTPAWGKAEPDLVSRLLKEIVANGTVTMREGVAVLPPTGGLRLGKDDVILLNPAGVHYNNYKGDHTDDYISALEEVAELGTQLRKMPNLLRPKLVFITSTTQHFRTETGMHGHSKSKLKTCRARVPSNPRADLELEIIKPGVHVDEVVVWGAEQLGELHVGNTAMDCTHFCMPGVPDEVAVRVMQAAQRVLT